MTERNDNRAGVIAGDTHCHLSFADNADTLAAQAYADSLLMLTNTVTPVEWLEARKQFAPYPNIVVGFGMHPWWVDAAHNEHTLAELLEQHCPTVLGEVGLDFSGTHAETSRLQILAFATIAGWAAQKQERLLSIHAVQAVSEVLEILKRARTLQTCTCIFHWFSGSSDELQAAIKAGCYFSINRRMLKTGKGREYVKAIPADKLLLESDLPSKPHTFLTFEQLYDALEVAAVEIAALKGADTLPVIMEQTKTLLLQGGSCEQ